MHALEHYRYKKYVILKFFLIFRFIPLHVKVYLWELIIIGLIGGVVATYSALLSIISHDSMSTSCWALF